MTRNDFMKKVIQVGLLGILSFVVFSLRNRIIHEVNTVQSVLRTENAPGERNAPNINSADHD